MAVELKVLLLVLFVCVSGCGEQRPKESTAGPGRGDQPKSWPLPLPPPGPVNERNRRNDALAVVASANAALLAEPDCVAMPGGAVSGCDLVDVTFVPATPKMQGDAVLILDKGMYFSAYTRYARRVLGIYERKANGAIEATPSTISMSRGAYHVAHDIFGESAVPVFQSETEGLAKEFSRKFSAGIPASLTRFEHGTPILNMIADLVPQAEFVVVNNFGGIFRTNDELCAIATTAGYAHAQTVLDRSIADLTALIDDYAVRYINLSSGHAFDVAQASIQQACPSANAGTIKGRDAALWQRLVLALGTMHGVTLVEAAPYPNAPLTVDDPAAPVDCATIENRVRVGYFTQKTSGIDDAGRLGSGLPATSTVLEGHGDQQNAKACVDLFVNAGFDQHLDGALDLGTAALYTSKWGLDARRSIFEDNGMSTSYATPLALSYLMYLQYENARHGEPTLSPEALRDAADGSGERPFRDPLRNGTLESLRL